uniref:Uncharacterized protein n=1 Tax=Strongyloides papillosus TaxID=174720 RepID=A0A0N5C8P2_STREA
MLLIIYVLMTDDNITTLDSSSNFILEHTMEEFNKDTDERESSIKKNQFQRTIDILSIDINSIPLDNETKYINNLIGLPIEDKHSIDRTSEGNNTISEINLAKKIEKGDSTHQFAQVKDISNNNICLNEANSPVGDSLVNLQTNSISNNYPFIRKIFSEKDFFGKDKMKQTDLTFHIDKKTVMNESVSSSSELKKNTDLPNSPLSFFLPNDPKSSSSSNDDEFDFEYQIVEDGNISSSLESIDSYNRSNLTEQSLKTNNNTLAKSTDDENVSYYNLPDKKLSNANNLKHFAISLLKC